MEFMFKNVEPLLYQKAGANSTPLRQVHRYEIEYQIEDGGQARINDDLYPIKKGQILFAKPGMIRNTTGAYQCFALQFTCTDHAICKELNQLPDLLSVPNSIIIEELLRRAYETHISSDSRSLLMEGILMQVLAEYMDASLRTEQVPQEYKRYVEGIYQTVDYMRKHFTQEISCEQLAKQMYISTNFYQKIFKKVMNISPALYLRNIRISEACRLLTYSDLSVQEIAEQCGFSCSSYFIYVLRKQLGVTPLEYRKINQTFL